MASDYDDLWDRARRAFGGRSPAEAIKATRAIVGPGVIPESEKAAQLAMEKLQQGDTPDPAELIALEFVIRIMRPAPLTHDGLLDPLDATGGNLHPPDTVARWEAFRTGAQGLLGSVGRIDHAQLGHVGTGFLVRPDTLATNRHVLDLLTGGAGVLLPGTAEVRFHCELGAQEPASTKTRLLRVLKVHPQLDIALFEVAPAADRPPLPLDLATPVDDGHPVAVVGFPAESNGANPLFADAIYGGKYGIRRGAVGEIVKPLDPLLFHDCSTLGGNSGSPIFSLLSRQVIGIHRSGWFAYRNEAIAAREVRATLEI